MNVLRPLPLMLARGAWQRAIVCDMSMERGALHPALSGALKGRARMYREAYCRSFDNLVRRLRSAGWDVYVAQGRWFIDREGD